MNQPLASSPATIAIVGAGLSGLCLAHGLLAAGFDVHVYEKEPSPDTRRQGYRITLDQHGSTALRRCLPPRLFEAVLATASPPLKVGYFTFTNGDLKKIFRLTFRSEHPEQREFIGQVDRATLRALMLAGLGDRVHFAKPLLRIEERPDRVVLGFDDGSRVEADVAVGADGIGSPMRRQRLPDCPVIDTGFRAIYGKTALANDASPPLVPETLANSGVMALGIRPGRLFFFTSMRFTNAPAEVFAQAFPGKGAPVTGDYVMWAVAMPAAEAPQALFNLDSPALHRFAADAAGQYHPVLRHLVDRAEPDFTVATALSAATRPRDWPASRVTLVGDAVHAMPPTGGHGGNTALRDAALLTERLVTAATTNAPLVEAIGKYQQEMLSYAFAEVDRSLAMLKRGSLANPVLRWAMTRALPALRGSVV